MADKEPPSATQRFQGLPGDVPSFAVEVIDGVNRGLSARAVNNKLTVGRAEGADLRLTDNSVSKWHFELTAIPDGISVRDLGSANQTIVRGVAVQRAIVSETLEIIAGRTRLRLDVGDGREAVERSERDSFGALVGASAEMREVYRVLELVAPTNIPVLITGEMGTGKELAARALHNASLRASKPYCVVDCSTMAESVIESELFGHLRGAFTGATHDREGAFEEADGGTLFLDEFGELPVALQQKLLRALAEGQIKRVGENRYRKVDVRIVAATNRDLREAINRGHFREDLYHRVAACRITMPALRDRTEDLQQLVEALVARFRESDGLRGRTWEPDEEFYGGLLRHHWSGNVRELANHVRMCLLHDRSQPIERTPGASRPPPMVQSTPPSDESLMKEPWHVAKKKVVERFEREYIHALLARTGGNRERAAELAGIDRTTFYRALNRHGIG